MLEKKISIGILCYMMLFSVGCQSKEEDLGSAHIYEEYSYADGSYTSPQTTTQLSSGDIRQNYENINKDELEYTYPEEEINLYNDDEGIYSGKRYSSILPEFTFESEVNPSNVSYEKAVELSKKVLPEDIEEVNKSEHNSGHGAGRSIIYYKSSIGNFKVSFTHPYAEEGTRLNKDKVVGISYMIEVVE